MYSDVNALGDIIDHLLTHSLIFRMCILATFIGISCTFVRCLIWSFMAKRSRRSDNNDKELHE